MAQPPRTQVEAGTQAQVAVVAPIAAVLVETVVNEPGVDAAVALRRGDIPARMLCLGGLRHADIQLQAAAVEGHGCAFNQCRQIHTGGVLRCQCVQIGRLQR
ncbi:hypothetical protein D3C75_636890 [compost metagenome]